MNIKKQKKSSYRTIITISFILIITTVAAASVFLLQQDPQQYVKDSQDPAITHTRTSPSKNSPNSHDKKSAIPDSAKDVSPSTDHISPKPPDDISKKYITQMAASVTVTDGIVYIRGGINSAAVSSGQCYAELTGPNQQIIKRDTQLLPNAATTDCKTIKIATNQLSKGSWLVILKYTSPTMEGSSNAHTFEVL